MGLGIGLGLGLGLGLGSGLGFGARCTPALRPSVVRSPLPLTRSSPPWWMLRPPKCVAKAAASGDAMYAVSARSS